MFCVNMLLGDFILGGGFKYFLSPLPGEVIQFD